MLQRSISVDTMANGMVAPQTGDLAPHGAVTSRSRLWAGIIGAALFYGDALITPAVSVLSAVEGLNEYNPAFGPFVMPLTALILIVLFSVQMRGTARVAAFFGPVTTVWFIAIALPGLYYI